MNDRFLEQIAEYYLDKEGKSTTLRNTCFITPNKRSALFLRKYFHDKSAQKNSVTPVFMPRFTTMSRFMGSLVQETTLATPAELLFVLYTAYKNVFSTLKDPEKAQSFDDFVFWGNVLIGDFNDIDANEVDAAMLFKNLKAVREISSNYLNEGQIEAIESILGITGLQSDTVNFWKHLPNEPKENGSALDFIALWEILGPIYTEYKRLLKESTPVLTYPGAIQRDAAAIVKQMQPNEFASKRYVFVGFNNLTTAQLSVLRRMKDLSIADFFWDTAAPMLGINGSRSDNPAARIISSYASEFRMPTDFTLKKIDSYPEIKVVGVPSNSAQSKVVASVLKDWANNNILDPENAIDTAVVMPDENLLMSMLHSVPPDIKRINVTMGMPYSTSSFASLLRHIISMQMRAREIHNRWHFYHDDVVQILSHPNIRLIDADKSTKAIDHIETSRLYNIDADSFVEMFPEFKEIFQPVTNGKDYDKISEYMHNMLNVVERASARPASDPLSASDSQAAALEQSLIAAYRKEVEQLCGLAKKYSIGSASAKSYFSLLERSLRHTIINLSGTPLQGLQIMGVLETRSLDFSNIVLMSMNERIFPRKKFKPSLIPHNLRKGYHLPTIDTLETDYAYQFYRLISRAKNVTILYDSRTAGMSSGEMSRYLHQIISLHSGEGKSHLTHAQLKFGATVSSPRTIVVNKDENVIAQLHKYKTGNKNISASALKAYRNCPLQFYLKYVCGLRDENQVVNYMDASTYGTVVHRVAELLYQPYTGKSVTSDDIDNMLAQPLAQLAREVINEEYHKGRYTNKMDSLPGESRVLSEVIAVYVKYMLEEERKFTPFVFEKAEFDGIPHKWAVSDKHTINFKMSIDRIDRIGDNYLRFIDYKTGADNLSIGAIDRLFSPEHTKGNDAIFQLLTYCYAYSCIFNDDSDIQPIIYKLRTLATEGIQPLLIGGKKNGTPLMNYKPYMAEFVPLLEQMIDQIFEEENKYPFVQTPHLENCRFCPFISMCGRTVPEKKY